MNVREKLFKGTGNLPATSLRVVSFDLLGCIFNLDFESNLSHSSPGQVTVQVVLRPHLH